MKHQHYYKNVKHLETIDVYRVLDLFAVTDPALAHAAKKILCAGGRGVKDQAKDVQEAIDSLLRWQEMQRENLAVDQKLIDDRQAAALVHDAELDPALVEPCSNTTIHADKDGWIEYHGEGCPVSDETIFVEVIGRHETKEKYATAIRQARYWDWINGGFSHWRYAK